MIEKNIDEDGEPLLKGQDPEKKVALLQARTTGYIKYHVKELAKDLGRTESEIIVLSVRDKIESHYGENVRKTNVIQTVFAVIQKVFKRRRSIPSKTTNSHGNK